MWESREAKKISSSNNWVKSSEGTKKAEVSHSELR
jgi:hypothetical protein